MKCRHDSSFQHSLGKIEVTMFLGEWTLLILVILQLSRKGSNQLRMVARTIHCAYVTFANTSVYVTRECLELWSSNTSPCCHDASFAS
jgi:hypothetical protein